ncbi:MAG: uracil-DNA glycosylase [Thiothrix sp.]|nr:MAG: uracil-DNA glycosylase [Thiothrix sp.]
MGIPLWIPKDWPVDEEVSSSTEASLALFKEPLTSASQPLNPPSNTSRNLTDLFAETSQTKITAQANTAKPLIASHAPDCSQLTWAELEAHVTACKLCELHKTRTQTVFGSGNQQARCMIIGEAPGAEEDRQGLPFVGKSGKLLTNMLASIQIARDDIYIANILKCRPPNNRDPKPEEAAACRGYLERQIALVQPKLILVVGRIAAHNLLQTNTPLGRLRGSVHTLPNSTVPVIVTYHPAYLLRQPAEKRRAWQDLQLARDFLASLSATS